MVVQTPMLEGYEFGTFDSTRTIWATKGIWKKGEKRSNAWKTRLKCRVFCPQKGWTMMGNQLIICLAIGLLVT